MLTMYWQGRGKATVWNTGDTPSAAAQWLDLVDPTDAEREAVEELLDAALPQRNDMNALGLSSRHGEPRRVLSLHARLYPDDEGGEALPLGIAVTAERLVTLRYASSRAVHKAMQQLAQADTALDGPDAFLMLLQSIANDVTDAMQTIATDLGHLSRDVFTLERERTPVLRDKLLRVGHLEGQLARYRTSLLSLGRVAGFVANRPPEWFDEEAVSAAKVVVNDLKTLGEFEDQLTNKLTFLQDAVLGFISTDQNAVMKLFTAASVVTIPPVIVAGVWGMNFKHMPELDTPWGYPVALGVMLVSILVPLAWFGARGWLSRD